MFIHKLLFWLFYRYPHFSIVGQKKQGNTSGNIAVAQYCDIFDLIICTTHGIHHSADTIRKHRTGNKEALTHSNHLRSCTPHCASPHQQVHRCSSSPLMAAPVPEGWDQHKPLPKDVLVGLQGTSTSPQPQDGCAGVLLECCYSPAVSIWHPSPSGLQPAGTV